MELIGPLAEKFLTDMNPARLIESFVLLAVLWWKVNPHLKKFEERLDGIAKELNRINVSMLEGFANGEVRFQQIENRVERLENKKE